MLGGFLHLMTTKVDRKMLGQKKCWVKKNVMDLLRGFVGVKRQHNKYYMLQIGKFCC